MPFPLGGGKEQKQAEALNVEEAEMSKSQQLGIIQTPFGLCVPPHIRAQMSRTIVHRDWCDPHQHDHRPCTPMKEPKPRYRLIRGQFQLVSGHQT